jgi:hypothetical protein
MVDANVRNRVMQLRRTLLLPVDDLLTITNPRIGLQTQLLATIRVAKIKKRRVRL